MRGLIGLFWLIATPLYALSPFATDATGQGIIFAQYQDDLDIYPHRIMGSIREKDTLFVRDHTDKDYAVSVSQTGHVFEDVKPHIGDMDGDGFNDVMVVETSVKLGASIAVYSMATGTLRKIGQTPYVGRASRWYAPVGFGDFNDDGNMDLAFVDRPHLARILRVFTLTGGALREVAAASGVTNHAIGDEVIWGGVRRCNGRDEIVVKDVTTGRVTVARVTAQGKIAGTVTPHKATPRGYERALNCH